MAGARPSDREDLEGVLANTRWRLAVAPTGPAALRMLETVRAPVILWDRDTPGMEWRQALGALAALSHRPVALLLSDVNDPYLWEEVVRARGFDVLARPLCGRRVLAKIEFAYRHWEAFGREVA